MGLNAASRRMPKNGCCSVRLEQGLRDFLDRVDLGVMMLERAKDVMSS